MRLHPSNAHFNLADDPSDDLSGPRRLGEEVAEVWSLDEGSSPLVVLLEQLDNGGVGQDGPVHEKQHLAMEVNQLLVDALLVFVRLGEGNAAHLLLEPGERLDALGLPVHSKGIEHPNLWMREGGCDVMEVKEGCGCLRSHLLNQDVDEVRVGDGHEAWCGRGIDLDLDLFLHQL